MAMFWISCKGPHLNTVGMKFLLRTNQFPLAVPSDEKPGVINRTLKFVGKGSSQNLYFRLAQGNFEKTRTTSFQ